ncbi:MmgE/PrpD family protein [Aquabacter sp. CN5-332]|uniref:MmgE/PrpD family protein n=1 Tax=Aquabacter sp. CN5-332 TaxID=3156608 RepID=UPI0032B36FE2
MNRRAPISRIVGEFASEIKLGDIPEAIRHTAKLHILDSLGVGLVSSRLAASRSMVDALADGSAGTHGIIGSHHKVSLSDALLANGMLINGIEYDDTSIEGRVHPNGYCTPVALWCGNEWGVGGRDILVAYIVGIEIAIRVGAASKGTFQQRGVDIIGLSGAFGAAVLAGRLLGLDGVQMSHAQGIAHSMAAGSREFTRELATTKALHPAWAGVCGVTAARLARSGMIVPSEPYEGLYGLYRIMAAERFSQCDLSLLTEGLGETWLCGQLAVKPLPACYFLIPAIDAAIALRNQFALPLEEIRTIEVFLPRAAINTVCEPAPQRLRPQHSYAAQFSIYYSVAAALVRGRFGLEEIEAEALADPVILDLAGKVTYREDETSTFPANYTATLHVEMRDGSVYRHEEREHRGGAARPMTEAQIIEKFMANAIGTLTAENQQRVRDTVLGLESAGSVVPLLTALSP